MLRAIGLQPSAKLKSRADQAAAERRRVYLCVSTLNGTAKMDIEPGAAKSSRCSSSLADESPVCTKLMCSSSPYPAARLEGCCGGDLSENADLYVI